MISTYEYFNDNETVKYGSLATSASVNKAPLFLKKELNNLSNYTRVKFGDLPLEWNSSHVYEEGEICYYNGVIYKALVNSFNSEPNNSDWEILDIVPGYESQLEWNNSTSYNQYDVVTHSGRIYVATDTTPNQNQEPPNSTYWVDAGYIGQSTIGSSFVRTDRNSAPDIDNAYYVGSSTKRFKGIYAVQFYGHLNGNASGVDPNSVTLGTDTTGDYVKDLTAGSGISISGGTGEGSTPTISHSDTSSQTSVNNSNGVVIQDITLDTFGHITGIGSYNLDDRYYTESEADSRFVNVTGDTISGNIVPDNDNSIDLGSSSKRYKNIYAVNIHGSISGTVSDADKLDGLDSSQFVRSDVDDTINGNLTTTKNILFNTSDTGINWTMHTDFASIKFYNTSDSDTNSRLEFNIGDNGNEDFLFTATASSNTTELLRISPDGGQTGLKFRGNNVWHAGNDGSGSGLDADKLDGIQASQFLRSDTNDTHSSNIAPTRSNTYNLGSSSKKYKGIYAVEFYGKIDGGSY